MAIEKSGDDLFSCPTGDGNGCPRIFSNPTRSFSGPQHAYIHSWFKQVYAVRELCCRHTNLSYLHLIPRALRNRWIPSVGLTTCTFSWFEVAGIPPHRRQKVRTKEVPLTKKINGQPTPERGRSTPLSREGHVGLSSVAGSKRQRHIDVGSPAFPRQAGVHFRGTTRSDRSCFFSGHIRYTTSWPSLHALGIVRGATSEGREYMC